MNPDYVIFVDELTPAQVRALASQVGISGCGSVSGLRTELRDSQEAQAIWERVYGTSDLLL